MISKFQSIVRILKDAKIAANPKPQMQIFDQLHLQWDACEAGFSGLDSALGHSGINRCKRLGDWEPTKDELFLKFESSLFSNSEIRAYIPAVYKSVLVFLPGSLTGAEEVLCQPDNRFYLKEFCANNDIALFVWDWPLQGKRRQGALYQDIQSHGILEREYARMLTMYGSSLWHEYMSELKFCLEQIKEFTNSTIEVTVMGWSQGAWFSYFAPLLGLPISKIICAGSCARFEDLLKTGTMHVHGFFYYPVNCMKLFDLEHVVLKCSQKGTKIHIVYGQKDRGCIDESLTTIKNLLHENSLDRELSYTTFEELGHEFSPDIKKAVLDKVLA